MEQDYRNRSTFKTQAEMDVYSADPQSFYKRLSSLEREIMALIMPGKSGKPIAGMVKLTLKTSAVCRAHLAELGGKLRYSLACFTRPFNLAAV